MWCVEEDVGIVTPPATSQRDSPFGTVAGELCDMPGLIASAQRKDTPSRKGISARAQGLSRRSREGEATARGGTVIPLELLREALASPSLSRPSRDVTDDPPPTLWVGDIKDKGGS